MRFAILSLSFFALALATAGCSSSQDATSTGAQTSATSTPATTAASTDTATPPETKTMPDTSKPASSSASQGTTNDNVAAMPKDGDEVAVINTNQGEMIVKFFPDIAPKTVENFKKLASSKFYDGTKFHRVIANFMIQGGDPKSKDESKRAEWGTGGPDWKVPAEFSDISHVRGIVSMARSSDPNSAGSQFFIVVAPSTFLDHQYTAFGYVVKGMDVADKIVALPNDGPPSNGPSAGHEAVMKTVKIEKWPVKS
ncbi:MAG TPA: peptidylprolyl isomerase [Fimbriimonadaceae bacterium]|jgi:peptidyl-prolyl cis-trans isomerase B (cyclophilin B)